MPHYRDEGIVLRTHKLGEVDRIVTVLTKNHGQIRAVAKGVRKTSSRFGARLEPFMVADLQLYEGKNLDTVSQAEQLANYGSNIVSDYAKYTAGTAILEAAERLTRESSSSQHYLLVIGAIRTLANLQERADQVLDSYLLRSLSISGWVPSLDACHTCGNDPIYFSTHSGAVSCQSCQLAGAVSIGSTGLSHMRSLLAGDWASVANTRDADRARVSGVIAAYLQWQLERGLKSLQHVERA
jgi:DNA repair protein RecO (recombination protein O)